MSIIRKLQLFFIKLSQKEFFWIIFLAVVNLLVILKAFRADFLLGADEFSFQYDGFFLHKTSDFVWNEWVNMGAEGVSVSNYLPWLVFFDILKYVFSYQILERILYFLLYFSGCLVMFKLLVRYYKINYLVASFASFLYVFNVFHVMMPAAINVKLVMIAMPLTLFVLEGFIKNGKIFQNAIFLNFALLVLAQASSNPPAISIVYFLIAAYLVLAVIMKRTNFKKLVIFSLVSAFIFVLINFWWLVVLVPSMINAATNIIENTGFATVRTSAGASSIANSFRYMGYWAWWSGMSTGHFYVPFAKTFNLSNFFIAYSFFTAILAYLVVNLISFFNLKKRRIILFWLIIFMFSVFMSKGTVNPGGDIFVFLWDNFPMFKIFRDPWAKFTPLIIISSVILSAILLDIVVRKIKYLVPILIITLFFHLHYFAFHNSIYYNDNFGTMRTLQVSVPNYWKEYSEYIGGNKLIKRNLIYPKAPNGSHFFEKGFSSAFPFASIASRQPVIIFPNFSDTGNLNDKIIRDFYDDNLKYNNSYLGFFNIGYITQQNDYNWPSGYVDTPSPSAMAEILGGSNFLKKEKDFGNFKSEYLRKIDFGRDKSFEEKERIKEELLNRSAVDVYKVKAPYFIPHLYISTNAIVSGRSIENFPAIISSQDWQARSAVFFAGQNGGKEGMLNEISNLNPSAGEQDQNTGVSNTASDNGKQVLSKALATRGQQAQGDKLIDTPFADEGGVMVPTLEFKKINPTKYRVRVHSASGVFPLVFSESFHDGWKSYLVKSTPSSPQPSPRAGEGAISGYKILDGNAEDQATEEELQDFIQKGHVTTLGDGKEKTIAHKKWDGLKEKLDYTEKYSINFISKNFQGTIQNDNLPNGNILETWFQKPIENNANHLVANGYANSWVIDTNLICQSNSKLKNQISDIKIGDQGSSSNCIQNPDGSYDFELVVEFWPQRLFYIGLAISGLTLLGCITYLGYDYRKRKKSKRQAAVTEKA